MPSSSWASSVIMLGFQGGSQTTLTSAAVVDRFDLALDLLGQGLGDRAHRRGQGHVDVNIVPVVDVDLVDQAELEDVHRDLRIIDRAQRFDHPSLRWSISA